VTRRSSEHDGPGGDDEQRRLAREVRRALAHLVSHLRATKPGGHLLGGGLGGRELRLTLPLPRGEEEGAAADERLLSDLNAVLDEEIGLLASFRPGRVYCHRCAGTDCPHAAPPGPRSVFLGWTSTGVPRWGDFAQLCLERRHPLVDRLYADPPEILYQLTDGEELSLDLLPAVRRESRSEVLVQASIGLLSLGKRGAREDLRTLTAQAVSSRSPQAPPRLVLNLILGQGQGGADLDRPSPWRSAARTAQGKLDSLLRRTGGGRGRRRGRSRDRGQEKEEQRDLLRRGSTAILGEFARRVVREARGRGRRTRHAEERHAGGRRPTRTALLDLRRARPEELMVDRRSGALVVPGGRGRTHFFNSGGRLVSSVRYAPEELARKRKRGHWRPATPEEGRALLETLERSRVD
jgi:hypothetical protein